MTNININILNIKILNELQTHQHKYMKNCKHINTYIKILNELPKKQKYHFLFTKVYREFRS